MISTKKVISAVLKNKPKVSLKAKDMFMFVLVDHFSLDSPELDPPELPDIFLRNALGY